jgi:hypothetical protein
MTSKLLFSTAFAAAAFALFSTRAPAASGEPSAADVREEKKTYTCGGKGQPACPMQAWMKATITPAVASGDWAAVAKGIDYIAAHGPSEFSEWAAISKKGAAAARAGDVEGVKASCKACHDLYKAKYRAEMRDRPYGD